MAESTYGEQIEMGFWCEEEGIYYTDEAEHPAVLIGKREEDFGQVEDQGHFGYACRGAMLPPRRVAIVELNRGGG